MPPQRRPGLANSRTHPNKNLFWGDSYLLLLLGMKLTKRQKALIGVSVVALVGLVADRMFLAGGALRPSQAGASQQLAMTMMLPELTAEDSQGQVDLPESSAKGPTVLAQRLETIAKTRHLGTESVKDAFCPSSAWQGQDYPVEGPVNSHEVRAQRFVRQHQLEAVAMTPQGNIAIINGVCLRIAQRIEGFKLISVDNSSAVLVCDDIAVTLRLPAATPIATNRPHR